MSNENEGNFDGGEYVQTSASGLGDASLDEVLDSVGISQEQIDGQGVTVEDFDASKGQQNANQHSGKNHSSKDYFDGNQDKGADPILNFLKDYGVDTSELSDEVEGSVLEESEGESKLELSDLVKEGDDGETDPDDFAPTEESDLIAQVNKANFIHNGESIEVKSMEHLKELVQKGYDYQHRKEGILEDKKVWDSEKEKALEEYNLGVEELNKSVEAHQEQLLQNQIWDLTLQQLESEDPDLYGEISARAQQNLRMFKNPVWDRQMQYMQERINELESKTQEQKNNYVLEQFNQQKQMNQSLVDQLKSDLGLEVDWDKIKDRWAQGDSVKQAIGALYSDKITKLVASRKKVQNTKKTHVKKSGGVGVKSRKGAAGKAKIDFSKDYSDVVTDLANLF